MHIAIKLKFFNEDSAEELNNAGIEFHQGKSGVTVTLPRIGKINEQRYLVPDFLNGNVGKVYLVISEEGGLNSRNHMAQVVCDVNGNRLVPLRKFRKMWDSGKHAFFYSWEKLIRIKAKFGDNNFQLTITELEVVRDIKDANVLLIKRVSFGTYSWKPDIDGYDLKLPKHLAHFYEAALAVLDKANCPCTHLHYALL